MKSKIFKIDYRAKRSLTKEEIDKVRKTGVEVIANEQALILVSIGDDNLEAAIQMIDSLTSEK
jgi:hypothetical protein